MNQNSPYQTEYNASAIRKLLETAFNDEEFGIFCYDHFPSVYKKFSVGMTFPHKVHLLVEYCDQTNSFSQLLQLVKANNPNKYAEFSALLKKSTKVATGPQSTPQPQVDSSSAAPSSPIKIFISYSRKQIAVARRLAEDLQRVGFVVWWDVSDLKGGEAWGKTIQTAIKTSQYCLVLLTPDSVESDWVYREYMYALKLGLRVIPLYYRDCELPLPLMGTQYIEFRGINYDQGLKELRATLSNTTIIPQSAQPVVREKLLTLARDPIWQMIGVFVAVIALIWTVYTYYPTGNTSDSPTPIQTISTITAAPMPTYTLTPFLTSTAINTPLPTVTMPTYTLTPNLTPTAINTPLPTETPVIEATIEMATTEAVATTVALGEVIKAKPGKKADLVLLPKFLGIQVFDQANQGAQEAHKELENPGKLDYLVQTSG